MYQNDTLQFLGQEEGRIRWAKRFFLNGSSANSYEYDYFLKDHLGNVRMVLTEQTDTTQYIATMEAAYRTNENKLFYNLQASNYPKAAVSGYPVDATTNPNDSLMRLNGSGQKVGAAIVLKVMSGDVVDVAVKAFYKDQTYSVPNSSVNDILSALATGAFGLTGGAKGTLAELNNTTTSPLYGALNSFISGNNPTVANKPRAHLNWILLDEQFQYVSSYPQSGALAVGNYASNVLNTLAYTGIPITKNGYLYIYVNNETPGWDVYFDNMSVKHYSGAITEETHYYPFGLVMSGISSKSAGSLENKRKWNAGSELQSNEFSDGSGLELYSTFYRSLDPQLGRFWQIDPKPDYAQSLYSSMNNNPISINDPLGDTVRHTFRTGFLGIFGKKVTVDYDNGKYYNKGTNTEYTGKLRNYQKGLLSDLTTLSNNTTTSGMIGGLVSSTQVIQIKNGGSSENGGASFEAANAVANPGKPLIVNYSVGKSYKSNDVNQGAANASIPGFVALAHEFAHVQDYLTNGSTNFLASNGWYTSAIIPGKVIGRTEIFATDLENRLRASIGLPLREFYSADKATGTFEGRILNAGTRTNANINFINGGTDAAGNLIPVTY